MVQEALSVLNKALGGALAAVVPVVVVLGVALLGLLLVALLDRERARRGLDWALARAPGALRWGALALALAVGALGLRLAYQAADLRLATAGPQAFGARTGGVQGTQGAPTVQPAPSVVLLEEQRYTRSLLLPKSVYTQLELGGGWENLLPYFQSYDAPPTVRDLREGFTQQRAGLLYTREVTLLRERPLSLDTSDIKADLRFGASENAAYQATFTARYTFRNPEAEPRTLRFTFPLPYGSGTLSDFGLQVSGAGQRTDLLEGGARWEGVVPGGGVVEVRATYRNQGARAWSYQPLRREGLRRFSLAVSTDRPARFSPQSLLPTATNPGRWLRSERSWNWQLSNVVTAQDVSLLFTGGAARETLAKIGHFKPLSVLLLTLLLLGWAWTRRLPTSFLGLPLTLAGAALGLSAGLMLGSVLGFYLPLGWAEALGCAVGAALALRVTGRAFTLPVLIAAATPLAFLSGGHAALLLTLGLLACFVLLRPERLGGSGARKLGLE